jgi:hypothetical protein
VSAPFLLLIEGVEIGMQCGRRCRGASYSTSVLNVDGVIRETTSPSRFVVCTLEHHLLPFALSLVVPYLLLFLADLLCTFFVCLVPRVARAMTAHLRFDSLQDDLILKVVMAWTIGVMLIVLVETVGQSAANN